MSEVNQPKGEIVIYRSPEGPEVKVTFQDESVWLMQKEIAELFGTQRPAITKHLRNIYKSSELSEKSVCSILEHTAKDGKIYKTQYYNLDAIIAVGYRVNSKRATNFRIWATKTLREYVTRGFVLNEKRLKEARTAKLKELESAVKLLQGAAESNRLRGYEGDLLKIITDYTSTWLLLNKYDQGQLEIENVTTKLASPLAYDEAMKAVASFGKRLIVQKQAGEIFGKEYEGKFKAILGSINQAFGGQDLYRSVEEKAAHLLYLTIKDHPFVDGNKRIGSLMFLLFLIENRYLFNRKGERKITDNTLAALSLLVAESRPEQKDVMIKLIVNLINKK